MKEVKFRPGTDDHDYNFKAKHAREFLEEGHKVIVGVRPEHLAVADGGPIAHSVRAVEWLGHECLVFGSVGGSPVVVRQVGMAPHQAGGTIHLTVDPAQVHLFDPDSGDRVR